MLQLLSAEGRLAPEATVVPFINQIKSAPLVWRQRMSVFPSPLKSPLTPVTGVGVFVGVRVGVLVGVRVGVVVGVGVADTVGVEVGVGVGRTTSN